MTDSWASNFGMEVISRMATTFVGIIGGITNTLLIFSFTLQTTATRKLNFSSIYFESLPYTGHPDTGVVDYANLTSLAEQFKPTLIMCGASAYPRDWDYAAIRVAADRIGAWVLGDIAHLAGFI